MNTNTIQSRFSIIEHDSHRIHFECKDNQDNLSVKSNLSNGTRNKEQNIFNNAKSNLNQRKNNDLADKIKIRNKDKDNKNLQNSNSIQSIHYLKLSDRVSERERD